MQKNLSKSYVSRDESAWIKGALTLLIILGHNIVFTTSLEEYGVMSSLYLFHVQGFFILPFLYGISNGPYDVSRFDKSWKRYYWPYLFLTTVFTIGYGIYTRFTDITFIGLLRMLIICDGASIHEMCGLRILWFLPSMMTMVFLKELYYRQNTSIRMMLLLLSLGINISDVLHETYPLLENLPFGLYYSLHLLIVGVAFRAVVDYISLHKNYTKYLYVCIIVFVSSLIIYWSYIVPSDLDITEHSLFRIMGLYTPIAFITGLICILRFSKEVRLSWLLSLGNRSFPVYIISPFVGYALAFICQWTDMIYWWVGLLLWPVITYISYILSFCVRGVVEKIIFPK